MKFAVLLVACHLVAVALMCVGLDVDTTLTWFGIALDLIVGAGAVTYVRRALAPKHPDT